MSAYTASIFSFSTSETAFQARASASTIRYFNDSKLLSNKRAKAASAGPIRVNNILMRISADSRPTTLIWFYRFHFDSFIATLWSPAKAHEQAKSKILFYFRRRNCFPFFLLQLRHQRQSDPIASAALYARSLSYHALLSSWMVSHAMSYENVYRRKVGRKSAGKGF